jgi:hypothetical protein
MWYLIWFIGMGLTLACIISLISRLEAKSAFDATD